MKTEAPVPEQLDFSMIVDAPALEHLPPKPKKPGGRGRNPLADMADAAIRYGRYKGLSALMADVGRLGQYKPFNAFLALLQLPAASHLLPAHRWEDAYCRRIRPGQQPLVLLLPKGPVMFLFDVSQTEATSNSRPLPQSLRNPFAMQDAHGAEQALRNIFSNVRADGVRFHSATTGWARAGCIWPVKADLSQPVQFADGRTVNVPVRYESLFNMTYSATEQLATVAHELGHLYCGHVGTISEHRWPDRRDLDQNLMEWEAESVARVVFGHLYSGVEMPPYRDMPPGNALPDLHDLSFKLVMDSAEWILRDSAGPRRLLAEAKYKDARMPWPKAAEAEYTG